MPGCVHAQGFIKNTGLLVNVKLEFCMFYGSVLKADILHVSWKELSTERARGPASCTEAL